MIIIVSENSPGKLEQQAVKMMKTAIASTDNSMTDSNIRVIESQDINSLIQTNLGAELCWCPLTLNIPETLDFWGKNIFKDCREIEQLRQKVQEKLQVNVGDGQLWLPVILTDKGPIYAEVIGINQDYLYQQPIDFTDDIRQVLYNFGYQLLNILNAPSANYLIQFNWEKNQLIFDRLFPFPHLPAVASIEIQEPNLFTCHWYCLTGQPIYDIFINR